MPYLQMSDFLKQSDMVRIVPVEAPRNYTADVSLRKGSARDSSLPVYFSKTELEEDYPYLTKELAENVNKSSNFVAKAAAVLGLKGNPKFHQSVRSSKSGEIQRYSNAALSQLQAKLAKEPAFNPYKVAGLDA